MNSKRHLLFFLLVLVSYGLLYLFSAYTNGDVTFDPVRLKFFIKPKLSGMRLSNASEVEDPSNNSSILKITREPALTVTATSKPSTQRLKSSTMFSKTTVNAHSTTPATPTKNKSTPENPTSLSTPKPTTTGPPDLCPHPTLPHKIEIQAKDQISCKPYMLTPKSCKYVAKEYVYKYKDHKCGSQNDGIENVNICQFVEKDVKFKCNFEACGGNKDQQIYLHVFKDDTGWYEAVKPGLNNSKSLENALLEHVNKLRIAKDFVFLSCGENKTRTQLVHFDSVHFKETKPQKERKNTNRSDRTAKININVVWLDSLSRRHFYRSLPKTIQRITDINSDQSTKTEILDFEMMQAVHGHTHENLIAFFEGHVLPKKQRSRQPHLDNLLNFTRQSGYRNVYQEDMCYKGGWGFNGIAKAGGKWTNIVKGISKFAIDDTGLTFASCKMIESYSDSLNIFNDDKDL
ncbi:uncharacterized protein [Clytia hemisphaerica]|uniref:uncharacterized protein n=1 Tax=Clytia hemisphaerica TaxID=252671 RepID=UPI0034D6DD73|eukprot:TCONS_00010920-protein